jgi:hypothetical protein
MEEYAEVPSCDEIAVSATFHEDSHHVLTESKQSYMVDLLPETSNEASSILYRSNDAISKAK